AAQRHPRLRPGRAPADEALPGDGRPGLRAGLRAGAAADRRAIGRGTRFTRTPAVRARSSPRVTAPARAACPGAGTPDRHPVRPKTECPRAPDDRDVRPVARVLAP